MDLYRRRCWSNRRKILGDISNKARSQQSSRRKSIDQTLKKVHPRSKKIAKQSPAPKSVNRHCKRERRSRTSRKAEKKNVDFGDEDELIRELMKDGFDKMGQTWEAAQEKEHRARIEEINQSVRWINSFVPYPLLFVTRSDDVVI